MLFVEMKRAFSIGPIIVGQPEARITMESHHPKLQSLLVAIYEA
jgi:hypothetical protein